MISVITVVAALTFLVCGDVFAIGETEGSSSQPIQQAVRWLLSQRGDDRTWDSSTADVIIAMQLTNSSWHQTDNLDSQLAIKHVELELALALCSRRHDSPLRAGKVAKYVNALLAVCQDPRSFHDHDLVSILEHLDTSHSYEYSYVATALCNAGAHIKKKHIRRLIGLIEAENLHNHDTLSMTTLALTCIAKSHHGRNLIGYLRYPMNKLKTLQREDGSFGNIHTTALAIQAMQALGTDPSEWNQTAALDFILKHQLDDGSFGNLAATVASLPAIVGSSLISVSNTSCRLGNTNDYTDPALFNSVNVMMPEKESDGSNLSGFSNSKLPDKVATQTSPPASASVNSVEEIPSPKTITFRYQLWVGNNVTENFTLTMAVPVNTSFYNVMKMAAEQDEHYEFTASLWPNGHYVHTISGLKEDRTNNHYWLLGVINNPEEKPVFVDKGIDEFYPKDGDNIVYWYKVI